MRNCCQLVPAVAATLVAACGGSSTGTASVQLDPRGGWSGSAEVLVHHADGTMVSRAPITTRADVAVTSGDTITVAFHDAGQLRLASVTQIEPGDTMNEIAAPIGASDQRTSVDVHVPTVAGATQWSIATPQAIAFGDAGGTFSLDVPAGSTSVPILAIATSANDVLGMYGDRAAPITPGSPPSPPSIDLHTTVAWGPASVHVTGGSASAFLASEALLGEDTLLLIPPKGATTVPVPMAFGDGTAITASDDAAKGIVVSVGAIVAAPPSTAVELDLGTPALPTFTNGVVAADHLSWDTAGGGDYDLLTAYLRVSSTQYAWSLDAPPGTASITLPKLPADLASPAAFDSVGLVAYERSDVDGFAAAIHASFAPTVGSRWQYRGTTIQAPASVAATADRGKLDARDVLAALRR